MGRKASAKNAMSGMDAEATQKRQLETILEVLSGKRSVAEACESLAISEATFHRLKEKAVEGALEGLAPKPMGRPPKVEETNPEVERLKARVNQLEIELQCSRVREEIALVMPHVLKGRKGGKKKRAAQDVLGRNTGTTDE